jgi:hypothetical protein
MRNQRARKIRKMVRMRRIWDVGLNSDCWEAACLQDQKLIAL